MSSDIPKPNLAPGMSVFDRRAVRAHRDRSAPSFGEYTFLFEAAGAALVDRLSDIKRTFPLALDLGCHNGILGGLLDGAGGIETLIQADISEGLVRSASGLRLVADEEFLPVAPGSLDLVMSCLSLHWVNDLPGTLIQIREALKPDGLFLGVMLGGQTLHELRTAFLNADSETSAGAGPRVSPFAEVRDAGDLLMRAGFALPVADSDVIDVSYGQPLKLMTDLRGMGETNAVNDRQRSFTARQTILRAAEIYQEMFAGDDGRVPATFETIWFTAWAPDAAQPKPLARGSGTVSLADALKDDT